jgi:hypothetical protein
MITLTPAYGRDYKNKKEVEQDWKSNKDFIIADMSSVYYGKPANRLDLRGQDVKIRYGSLRKVMIIEWEN